MADTQPATTPKTNAELSQQTVDGVAVPKGVILPPPEIRGVIEKTAGYVARNGPGFEDRIRESEKMDGKFSFINKDDPYYSYYSWRVAELQNGGKSIGGDNSNNAGTINGAKSVQQKSNGSEAGHQDGNGSGFAKPPPLDFLYELPPVSAQDLDIIKLTALYVARNGTQFLQTLTRSESKNFQYDFLKPIHSLYPLFNQLVEQYKKVINPQPILLDKIKQGMSPDYVYSIINRARIRAEWTAHEAAETEKAAEAAELEREVYASIDWHDFVVVETIKFTEADERAALPPPMSKAQLEYASLEQKKMSSLRLEEAPPDFDEEEAKEEARRSAAEQRRETQLQLSQSDTDNSILRNVEENDESVSNESNVQRQPKAATSVLPPGMKIKTAGTSRRNKKATGAVGGGAYGGAGIDEPMVESPLTGERIPQSQLEEHMRITLLDPKWKEQKALADSRRATTNLSTSEVATNIKRLASHLQNESGNGADNEGGNGESNDGGDAKEPLRKKQATEVQWDGYSRTKHKAMQQAAAQTSAKSAEESRQREMERLNRIGPKRSN